MPFVTVPGGVRLHYRAAGPAHGPLPMLFVHGWCSNLRDWEPQARAFSRRHRVVRVDLRGHGASDAPRGGYRLRTFASDVEAVAGQLGIGRALLVGHSLGGGVVLELARRAPALAAGVVMVDGIVGRGRPGGEVRRHPAVAPLAGPDYRAEIERRYRAFFRPSVPRALVERVVSSAVRTPRHAALGSIRAIYRDNVRAAGRRVRAPALYIAASTGRAGPATIREIAPEAAFAQVVGSGHFAQLEVPRQVNEMLRSFIRGL